MPQQNIEKAVELGWRYLESASQDGFFPCDIAPHRNMEQGKLSPREPFSTILITDLLLKNHLNHKLTRATLQYVESQSRKGRFTFFEDRNIYPPDAETNTLGYSILFESGLVDMNSANTILDTILGFRNKDGLVQVWLSDERKPNRIDQVVATNVLYFAHLLGRGAEFTATEDYIFKVLDSKEYLNGSRYYHSPDSFLYFVGRLIEKFPSLKERFEPALLDALQERIGKTEYPLDLAMRTALANILEIPNEEERQKLLQLQKQGGSWPIDSLFHYGAKSGYFGSEAITTAFSLKALESADF
jgi:hypothetical protein